MLLKDRDINYQELGCLADTALQVIDSEIRGHPNRSVVLVTHELNFGYPLAVRTSDTVITSPATLIDHAMQYQTALVCSKYAANTGRPASEQVYYNKRKGRSARAYGLSNADFPPRSVVKPDGLILTVVSADGYGVMVEAREDEEIAKLAFSRMSLASWNRDITNSSSVINHIAERLNIRLPDDRSGAVVLTHNRGTQYDGIEKAVPVASQAVRKFDPRVYEIVLAKCRDTVGTQTPSREPDGIRGAVPIRLGEEERVLGVGGMPDSNEDIELIKELDGDRRVPLRIISRLS